MMVVNSEERAGAEPVTDDGSDDVGEALTSEESVGPFDLPSPELDGIDDASEQARVFEALFELPAERQTLGRYVVLGALGRGGMGVVLEAFDRTLDRRVALKVLRRELDERYTTWLLREAQALAKLSHPNVVQVYEADTSNGQAFIAMELVRGESLREWLRHQPRPHWRECVRVLIQAGEGLAAAHAQGLVHRDFKPGNAIIDDDGRVRVLDFGLARGTDRTDADRTHADLEPNDAALKTSLTKTGAVVGTPAYMPLEQMRGDDADARSDQFSLAVSLYEAVYGERPFDGSSKMALMVSMMEGQVRAPPKGTSVPASLRQVLLRGLAPDPADRWPSIDAMLVQLRKQVAPRRWRWATMAAGVMGGLGVLGAGLAYQADMGRRCTGARAELEGVWDEARRQEVGAAILGTALSYAPSTWERVEQRLDDYADAWVRRHTETCEATSIRKEQSDEEMSLRMSCLRMRRTDLRSAVKVLADADAEVVENAVALVTGLPLLDRCDDLESLARQQQRVPPPEDPQVAQQVEALKERMAEVSAEQAAGKYDLALEHVQSAFDSAEALGYMPIVAEAMCRRGDLQGNRGHYDEAERDLERGYMLAAEHDYETMEFLAAIALAELVGSKLQRHAQGMQWGKTALPVAMRSGDAAYIAMSLTIQGIMLSRQGEYEEAEALHRRAEQLRKEALGANHPDVALSVNNIGSMLSSLGKYEDAEAQHRRALEIQEIALGADHPHVGTSLNELGIALKSQGKDEESEAQFRRALRIWEGALGADHPDVAMSVNNLGIILKSNGKYEEAEAQFRRALRIQQAALGTDHPVVAASIDNLGNVLDSQGKVEEAEQQLRRSLRMRETLLGAEHPDVANSANNLAVVLNRRGKLEEAGTQFRRALTLWEGTLGAEHPHVAHALAGLARVELARQDFEAARAYAERAVSIREADTIPAGDLAEARFLLARALWSDETQRVRARELAEQAGATLAESGAGHEGDRAEAERWLAEHHVIP